MLPKAHSGEGVVTALLFCASTVSVLCVAGILGFLLWFCLPLLNEGQLASVLSWNWQPFSGQFGILPMVVGSLLLGSAALLLAWPLGLGLCLFVHGLGPAWAARPLMALVRLMTSIPTVVYGLVSVFLLVPLIRSAFSGSGFSLLASALTLSLLVLPTVVLVLDGQLRQVAPGLRLTAAALGLTRSQELVHLALPLCARGLKTAAVLGFGRAVGDTLVPLMLSGNAAQVPGGPLDSLRSLTAHIALVVATDSQSGAYTSLFACGALLFGISLAVNLGLRRLGGATQPGQSATPRLALNRNAARMAPALAWTSVLTIAAALCALLGFLLWRGAPTLSLALFFGDTPPLDVLLRGAPVFDGLWPACLGTLYLVGLASALAIPLGLASGVHLAEFATGRAARLASACVDLLAGVPSILMGLFGFALILLLRRTLWPSANTCLLLSALCLALLVLPYVISATRTCLEALPQSLRLTAASLGLTRWQTVSRVLLPAASRGLLGGVILAVGRAAEDTAVIMLTGVVVGAGTPGALTDKFEALPFTIYYLAAEHQTPQELDLAFGAALTLLCLTALLFAAARRLHAGLAGLGVRRFNADCAGADATGVAADSAQNITQRINA